MKAQIKTIALAASLIAILSGTAADLWARTFDGSSGAGTVISNRAEASYQDETGESFTTASPTVTITVLAVATLAVTPDETAPSDTVAPRDRVTRLFRICNTGNNTDTFTLTRFDLTAPATVSALYFDTDGSGTLTDGDGPGRASDGSEQRKPGSQ